MCMQSLGQLTEVNPVRGMAKMSEMYPDLRSLWIKGIGESELELH